MFTGFDREITTRYLQRKPEHAATTTINNSLIVKPKSGESWHVNLVYV